MNDHRRVESKLPVRPAGGRDASAFFLGIVVALVTGVPVALFGITMFADQITTAILIMVAVLLLGALVFSLVYIGRHRLFGWFDQRVASCFREAVTPVLDGVTAVRDREFGAATDLARQGIERWVSWYAWVHTRAFMLRTLLGIVVAFGALIGSALLFKQNETLESQSRILASQTVAITEQTDAMREQNRQLAEQIVEIRQQGIKDRQQRIANAVRQNVTRLHDSASKLRAVLEGQYSVLVAESIADSYVTLLGPECTPEEFIDGISDGSLVVSACVLGVNESEAAQEIQRSTDSLVEAAITLRGGVQILDVLASMLHRAVSSEFDESRVINALLQDGLALSIQKDFRALDDASVSRLRRELADAIVTVHAATVGRRTSEMDGIVVYLRELASVVVSLEDEELNRLALLSIRYPNRSTFTGDFIEMLRQVKESDVLSAAAIEAIEGRFAMLQMITNGQYDRIGIRLCAKLRSAGLQSEQIANLHEMCQPPTHSPTPEKRNAAITRAIDEVIQENRDLLDTVFPAIIPMLDVKYNYSPFEDDRAS